jgi:hypothetical protein
MVVQGRILYFVQGAAGEEAANKMILHRLQQFGLIWRIQFLPMATCTLFMEEFFAQIFREIFFPSFRPTYIMCMEVYARN